MDIDYESQGNRGIDTLLGDLSIIKHVVIYPTCEGLVGLERMLVVNSSSSSSDKKSGGRCVRHEADTCEISPETQYPEESSEGF